MQLEFHIGSTVEPQVYKVMTRAIGDAVGITWPDEFVIPGLDPESSLKNQQQCALRATQRYRVCMVLHQAV
jgi:hypothetical protein